MPSAAIFPTEYKMLVAKWKTHESECPGQFINAMKSCDCHLFPNVGALLYIAITLPITSCAGERSFSQLKLIKTRHCSTMLSERLQGLALMKLIVTLAKQKDLTFNRRNGKTSSHICENASKENEIKVSFREQCHLNIEFV